MHIQFKIIQPVAALALAAMSATAVLASDEVDKTGWYHDTAMVDYEFVAPYAALPKRDDVVIIDSRPARKYSEGHIPTAMLVPDLKFDEMAPAVLPEAKDQLVIFYCGGLACKLSHKSAFKAEAMGYSNIKVYAAGYPDWKKQGGLTAIDTAQVQQLVAGDAPAMIVDARPKGAKYDKGHIPGAISIPDSKFEALAGLLPAAKDTPLVFYCGGYICKLSEKSAMKAIALGYTNVVTYPAGYPAWKKEVGQVAMIVAPDTAAAGAVPALPATGEGAIGIDEFKALLAEPPADLLLVDVRDKEEFAAGALPASINIPVGELEDKVFDLPDDKRIIFICTSGGRSGEAYDLAKLLAPGLNVAFLDAVVKYNADGTVELSPIN